MPRHDCNCQLSISVADCAASGGTWLQTETMAAVCSMKWHAQPFCIDQAISHDGWLYYRRPPPADSTVPGEGLGEAEPVQCERCPHRNPKGLVYCFRCSTILPGATEENVFATRTAVELRGVQETTVWGEGLRDETALAVVSRGANSEIAEIRQQVTLKSRPVTRPENPRHRGIRNSTVHQNPFEQWSHFCKKQHVRTTKEKGCKMSFRILQSSSTITG